MTWQFMRSGPAAVPAGLRLVRALLGNQGLRGTAGFAHGAGGVGHRGTRRVLGLLDDATSGNELGVRRRLGDDAVVTLGDDTRIGTSELAAALSDVRRTKAISSGRSVVVGLERDGRRSVLLAQLTTRPAAITRLRLFDER